MSKLLAYVFILGVLVAGQVAVMIYGWGLQPRSWWWIVGFGFFGNLFLHFIADKLRKESKEEN